MSKVTGRRRAGDGSYESPYLQPHAMCLFRRNRPHSNAAMFVHGRANTDATENICPPKLREIIRERLIHHTCVRIFAKSLPTVYL